MVKGFDLGKVPPQAVDIEEAVLGQLLLEPDAFKKISSILTAETFYNESHRRIFKVIKALAENQVPIDILTVTNELNKRDELDMIGGSVYIIQLTSRVASAAHIEYHARILQQKKVQRDVISLCYNYTEHCYSDDKDVDDIVIELENKLRDISYGFIAAKKIVTAAEVAKMSKEERSREHKQYWKTGHKQFDKVVTLDKNQIVMIAGAAGHGKTRFVSSIMFQLLSLYKDVSVQWVHLEGSAYDILLYYLASKTMITSKALSFNKYDRSFEEELKFHCQTFGEWDIEFVEKSAKIAVLKDSFYDFCRLRKDRLCILIIDNILSVDERSDYRHDNNAMYDYVMSEVLKIKQMTKQLIIPVHHYKSAQQDRDRLGSGYRPVLSDMKGTEAFRRTPDTVLLLNNPGQYPDLMNCYKGKEDFLKYLFICDVAKNRGDKKSDEYGLIRFLASLDYNIFEEL